VNPGTATRPRNNTALFRDVMLHPVAVASVLVMLLNDHVLKHRWPVPITGKLSDVAGLVFFPLLLVSLRELLRRDSPSRRRHMVAAVAVTGLMFATFELTPALVAPVEHAWAWARAVLGGTGGRPSLTTTFTADPTDLLTLPALGIAWVLGDAQLRRQGAP